MLVEVVGEGGSVLVEEKGTMNEYSYGFNGNYSTLLDDL